MAAHSRADSTDGQLRCGLFELDLLATHAGVPFPFPLRVPSFGRLPGERDVLLGVAGRTLAARGLADENGPRDAAAEVVTALREYRGTVDLVRTEPDGVTGAVAMVYRSSALICTQLLNDDPAGMVGLRRVTEHALADELLRLVPECPAARTMPVTLPRHAVDAAEEVVREAENDRDKERLLRDLVRDDGGDPRALDRLAELLSSLDGKGQIGATRRYSGRIERVGAELSWLDGPRGRVRIDRAGNDWLSVNPLRRDGIVSALGNLAVLARRPT